MTIWEPWLPIHCYPKSRVLEPSRKFLKKICARILSVIGVKRGEWLGAGEDIQGVNPGLWAAGKE